MRFKFKRISALKLALESAKQVYWYRRKLDKEIEEKERKKVFK